MVAENLVLQKQEIGLVFRMLDAGIKPLKFLKYLVALVPLVYTIIYFPLHASAYLGYIDNGILTKNGLFYIFD